MLGPLYASVTELSIQAELRECTLLWDDLGVVPRAAGTSLRESCFASDGRGSTRSFLSARTFRDV